MRLENRSIRGRLALFVGTAFGALCVAFFMVLLIVIGRATACDLTKEATAVGDLTAYYVDRGQVVNPLPPIPRNLVRPVQVVDPRGRVVAASRDLQNKPLMAHFTPRGPSRVSSEVVCHSVFTSDRCHIVVAQRVYRNGDWTVYSAVPTLPFYVSPGVTALLVAGTAVFSIMVVYGTRRVVARSLRPVDAIRAQLDDIQSTDLGRRVPIPAPEDEIYRLARSVNQTLDRLEDALGQQRRFCADASHELRTPITAIRAQLEDALLAPGEVDTSTLCKDVLPSVERLQSIACDLLTLTRLDSGVPCERRPVDLSVLVATELEGTPSHLTVVRNLTQGLMVAGDRSRLRQLVGNLVRNAQRHALSTVTITVRRVDDGYAPDPRSGGGMAELEVLDDGVGIAPDQREAVFRRFTRLDSARSRDAGGLGLGLPIAREIARSHGGTLTIRDSDRGACFVVRLPLSQ
ncbi:HAMP domain-containing sensor histidine kinase [Microbispora corallina]|uniref:histidine kinase n=1 Tax=Microbispora corallina TaxID=83302 RepID=A0ABQ4FV15_9ACTN|nr:HAMP domain-containing sensor histidine kinase [Microbispora corallina]GIH38654.1 two-component sensor histidine kinase [Microbispora corallina]